MESIAGGIPPLHRRFNEASSLSFIINRYTRLRPILELQVKLLQDDIESRIVMRSFYDDGYKDWHLTSAIYNMRMNIEAERLGISFDTEPSQAEMERIETVITQSPEVPSFFTDTSHITTALRTFDIISLRTYGFELRRPDYHYEAVQHFLRQRMKHYDLDLPHQPLFGKPPGRWPDI